MFAFNATFPPRNQLAKNFVLFVVVICLLSFAGCTPSEEAMPSDSTKILVQVEADLNEVFYGFDCSVVAMEYEDGAEVLVSMSGEMTEQMFTDFVEASNKATKQSLENCGVPLKSLSVIFTFITKENGTETSEVMKWETTDFITGTLFDSKEQFIKNNMSVDSVIEKYGSTGMFN